MSIAPSPGLQPPERLERSSLAALDREGTTRTYYTMPTRHPARKAYLHSHVSYLLVDMWTPGSDAYKQPPTFSTSAATTALARPRPSTGTLVFPVDAVDAGKASCARAQLVSYILFWTIKHADLGQGLSDAMYNLMAQLQSLVLARSGPDQLIAYKLLTFCHEHAGSVCYVLPFLALYESIVLKREVLELPHVKAQKALQDLSIDLFV